MGWARHNICGLRQEWLDLYLPDRVGRSHHSTLGNRLIDSLAIWLRTSRIEAAPIMELAGLLERILLGSELGQGQVSGDRPFPLVCRGGQPGDAALVYTPERLYCSRGGLDSPGPRASLGPRRFPDAAGSLFWNV